MKRLVFALLLVLTVAGALLLRHAPAAGEEPAAVPMSAGEEPAAVPAAAAEEELEVFTPSESLPADSTISFPVDI